MLDKSVIAFLFGFEVNNLRVNTHEFTLKTKN